jgi:hypothetical protein
MVTRSAEYPGYRFLSRFPAGHLCLLGAKLRSDRSQPLLKDVIQLAPGTQTYLEILWEGSWLVATTGGGSYYVRTLPPELGQAYLHMLTNKGPPKPM